jgi:UDP-2,3-diacylglucosamine hydrolase
MSEKKIYFASDFHLGAPNFEKSLIREKIICTWLESIQDSCEELYLLGDIFDFWYEYKHAVPKGFVRLLGKLAAFSDQGIPVYLFTGNHDMWAFDYLEKEIGIIIIRKPISKMLKNKQFHIGHGDGLGPGDYKYKLLKKVFENKLCQSLFGLIHPSIGIGLADFLSKRSRAKTGISDEKYLGDEKEWLISYCKEINLQRQHDFYVFGHRHLPIEYHFNNSFYLNIGDWIKYFSYASFDGENLKLEYYNSGN